MYFYYKADNIVVFALGETKQGGHMFLQVQSRWNIKTHHLKFPLFHILGNIRLFHMRKDFQNISAQVNWKLFWGKNEQSALFLPLKMTLIYKVSTGGFLPWGLGQFHQNAHSDHLKSPNAISNSSLFGLACHLQYDPTLLQYWSWRKNNLISHYVLPVILSIPSENIKLWCKGTSALLS